MIKSEVSIAFVGIVSLVLVIRGLRDIYHFMNFTIPQQLVQLVMQAHTDQEFHTLWNIEVNDMMKAALQAPLSAEQIAIISQLKDDDVNKSVNAYLLSHKFKRSKLSGIVCVSISISSKSGLYDAEYTNVQLRITVSHTGNGSIWTVSSVNVDQ